ncbi:MAG: hypothetical protein CVU98_12225 [Firmicutes bacterium HGW-Firmicutes-3]|jgi:methyl-accepting chemotaxis protein|nr:MAG: hypothetical protein CVU98_12225 [Firmicutes bacterium HGW-Firmicutes-3]
MIKIKDFKIRNFRIKDFRKLNLIKSNFRIKNFKIRNLKIGYKIAGSLGIIFLLFGLLSIFILFSVRRIEASSTEVKDTYMILVKDSNDLNAQMQKLATHIQLYLVTGNEDEYNEIMKNQDSLEKIMEKVESHVQSNPSLGELSDSINKTNQAFEELQDITMNAKIAYDGLSELKEETASIAPYWIDYSHKFFTNQSTRILASSNRITLLLEENGSPDEMNDINNLIGETKSSVDVAHEISSFVYEFLDIQSQAQLTKNSKHIIDAQDSFDAFIDSFDLWIDASENQTDKNSLMQMKNYTMIYRQALDNMIVKWVELDDEAKKLDEIVLKMSNLVSTLQVTGLSNTELAIVNQVNSIMSFRIILSIVLVIAFALVILLTIILVRGITNPVNRLVKTADELALGNLWTEQLKVTSGDELGVLTTAINKMQENIRGLITEITLSSDNMEKTSKALSMHAFNTTKTTEEVARTVDQISKGAMEQAHDTNAASDTIIELGTIIKKNTQGAKALEKSSIEINKLSLDGITVIGALIKNTNESKNAMDEILISVGQTNDRANKIGEASKLIKTIADQTNLLALNAAIEAARAGEHGRGFAVVASEIRKLAEQSTYFTSEIDQMLTELLAASKDALVTGATVKAAVETQVESVHETERSYHQIAAGIEESLNEIRKINEISQIMEENREEVMRVVEGLAGIAQENAASTQETNAASEEMLASMVEVENASQQLNELAEQLKGLISHFKLESNETPNSLES